MLNDFKKYLVKPEIYAPSTSAFWDDKHISAQMLNAHLNPDWDAASRKHSFIEKSAEWISQIAPPAQYNALLDLGCGPGLYAERFAKAGYSVTGLDFSQNSVEYAKKQSAANKSGIKYFYQNYLTMDYSEQFDLITLIYCDYAALSLSDRIMLLKKIKQALKPCGKFIFDVFKPSMRSPEGHTWQYCESGGFYTDKPHLCLQSVYQYEEDATELRQSVVITQDNVSCYNIWDHFFTAETIVTELKSVGFENVMLYGDVAGAELTDNTQTICCVVIK